METKLKIAVQKSGRLSEKSLSLLRDCGISFQNGNGKLRNASRNFPLEILFLRDDDIPQYVAEGVADLGILGENVVREKARQIELEEPLGFARCRLSLAVRREENYSSLDWFNGRKIATSYPKIVGDFLSEQGVKAEIEEISGSVEIAPAIGLSDAVCDIVSTGSTLLANGLREVHTVMNSEAVLISRKLTGEQAQIREKLLFRIRAVQAAKNNKYILMNVPNKSIAAISGILPGLKSPTILPLAEPGWSSLHTVVQEDNFWNIVDQLRELGAEGILVAPIEKLIVA